MLDKRLSQLIGAFNNPKVKISGMTPLSKSFNDPKITMPMPGKKPGLTKLKK